MKKNRIVFLDAGTLDYGDISFKEIEKLGELKIYRQSRGSQILARVRKATMVLTNKCPFSAEILKSLPDLRYIGVAATGVNIIDLKSAAQKKIAVTNVTGYGSGSVAQHTLALLLALAGNILRYNEAARSGAWSRSPFFMYAGYPVVSLTGKKLGIIGYGHIGRKVAQLVKSFGMKVLIAKIPGRSYPKKEGPRRFSFERVIRESDFVTIHAPLSDLTRDLINAAVIRKMKRSACLINVSRGGIVNEAALRKALENGNLAGAATDVLTVEPPPRNHILFGAPNLIITPHMAWVSRESRMQLIHEMALNIQAFQRGKRRNRII